METIKIGEACDILNGFAFKSKNYVDSGIRIIRIANVQKGYIEDNTPAFYPLSTNGLDKYMLESGDLLISLTGNVGRVALLDKEFLPAALNQRVACLRLKSNFIDKKYLFHILNSDFFEQKCICSSKGVAQKNMSTEWLKEYEIPLYSAKEQQKIAATLDKLQSIITHRRTQLEKLDLLVKARFVEMFGNIENKCTIADICSIITDGTHQPPKFTDSGIPFLFVSNIVTNEIIYNAEKFISEEIYNELYKRTPIEIGDIVLSTVGSYGHPAVVKSNRKFLFQRHIAYLKPISNIVNSVYLHSAILSNDVQRQIDERVKGIAQKTLNLSEIRKIVVPVPPLDLQTQFADFVKQVDQSKSILQQELDKAQTLFDSLMQEYFG